MLRPDQRQPQRSGATVGAVANRLELAEGSRDAQRVSRYRHPLDLAQRALKDQFEQNRAWLESIAQQAAGRKIVVSSAQTEAEAASAPAAKEAAAAGSADAAASRKSALREKALADAGVQALLEVFPAEIRDVEEM